MILVFDGPEKAGKTTLVAAVRTALTDMGVNVFIRKLGPCFPDDRVYGPAILADAQDIETVTIWDRSWAAEAVYAKLLGRQRRLKNDWFLGEWLYSRTLRAVGVPFMVLGAPSELKELRDNTDLPVDPYIEFDTFTEYLDNWNWVKIENEYTAQSLEDNVSRVLRELDSVRESSRGLAQPNYVGPQNSPVLIVGNTISEASMIPGGLTPFSSWLTTKMGREHGTNGLKWGWANYDSLNNDMIRDRELVVLCGRNVEINQLLDWSSVRSIVLIDNPSYTYRFNLPSLVTIVSGDESIFKKHFENYKENKDYGTFILPTKWL